MAVGADSSTTTAFGSKAANSLNQSGSSLTLSGWASGGNSLNEAATIASSISSAISSAGKVSSGRAGPNKSSNIPAMMVCSFEAGLAFAGSNSSSQSGSGPVIPNLSEVSSSAGISGSDGLSQSGSSAVSSSGGSAASRALNSPSQSVSVLRAFVSSIGVTAVSAKILSNSSSSSATSATSAVSSSSSSSKPANQSVTDFFARESAAMALSTCLGAAGSASSLVSGGLTSHSG